MPDKTPKVYWDACTFIEYVNGVSVDDPIGIVVEAAIKRRVQIYTSVISIAEVAYGKIEKNSGNLDKNIERQIEKLWQAGSPFFQIEVFGSLCHQAKALLREIKSRGRGGVGGADAIHLASARLVGVDEFHTANGRIKKLHDAAANLLPFKICDASKLAASLSVSKEGPQQTSETTSLLPFFEAKEESSLMNVDDLVVQSRKRQRATQRDPLKKPYGSR